MFIAGSVLAMLLVGLAVDGLVSGPDEEGEEVDPLALEEEETDQSGVQSTALSDLLFSGDDAPEEGEEDNQAGPDALNYTPLDQMPEEEATPEGLVQFEAELDENWIAASEDGVAPADLLDVERVTTLQDGSDVPLVDSFEPGTDHIVLDFDGAEDDAPTIEIEVNEADGSATILANGVPVSVVADGEGLTPEHIRVVMSEMGDGDPAVLPDEADTTSDAESRGDAVGGPATLPGVGDLDLPEIGPDAPLPGDTTDALLPNVIEEADTIVGDVIDTVETVLPPIIDPIVDVVETIGDGIPAAEDVNAILDGVTGDLSDLGGASDVLDARADMDDAFGTGGTDALTGTFNDDEITGTDGQDALFGDEGDDTLSGGAGNDELHGDFGDDVLEGGAGVDFLSGGEGNDALDGGGDRDLLFGEDGDDLLYGGAADDFLQGGSGADTLNGGSGNDVLDGTFSHNGHDQDAGDALWGGDGDDTIIVGQDDTAIGGAGADVFTSGDYIDAANGAIAGHVADFDPSQDRIEVIFDPGINPDPVVEVQDFDDGSGADILLNGEVILSVSGAQGLDPGLIDLRSVA
ncbi:calcium-binding protein [Hasllibacter sp. MH4015]|uniref:calcium-binding protein n=1 Tax=Hasllibacter sp. MH4015 TaxID=2854029 RepID=UPI001CD5A21E|nr:calcium-binding protein [Hasllibacter sp. MH4015]